MGIKLLVDICPLLRRRTGVGNYIFYLLRELIDDEAIDDVVGLCGTRFYSKEQLVNLLFSNVSDASSSSGIIPNQTGFKARLRQLAKQMPYARSLRVVIQAAVLAYQGRRYQSYIFWGGNYYLPLFLRGKCLLTIHDLSHIHYADCHPQDRVTFLNAYLPKAMCRADAITVVSEATAADVRVTFGDSMTLPPIFVVYPAVGEHFLTLSVCDTEALRVKYALPARFMLSVGTFEPRKNLHRLLDAYAMLDETLRAQCPLLLVGEKGWLADDIVTKLNTVQHVRWLGYVAEADMPLLYRLADVFVYLSLFEGFGMPIVEALAVGTRVIASNRGAMKEAAAGQADLVNPEDTLAISKLLAEVITCTNIYSDSRLVNRQPLSVHTWRERKSAMLSILYQMSN